jgi:hypothetical protein
MKKFLIVFLAGTLLATSSAVAAGGSAFGCLTTAKALGQGKGDLGAAIGLADATSFTGSLAYGLSKYSDGRIKLGLYDPGGGADTKLVFGVDYKWQFWSYGPETKHPFDFATGAFLEYIDLEGISILQIGGQLLGSYPIAMSNGGNLTPYGRLNARLESISWDLPPTAEGDDSESNLELGLHVGVQWEMSPTVALYGELQLDGNDGLFLGIDFNVM